AGFASFGWKATLGRSNAGEGKATKPRFGIAGRERNGVGGGFVRRSAKRVGGRNSVVESQPSKLLVAGSIPVSRSILRSSLETFATSFGWQTTARELRLAAASREERWAECRDAKADLSAVAPRRSERARRPM